MLSNYGLSLPLINVQWYLEGFVKIYSRFLQLLSRISECPSVLLSNFFNISALWSSLPFPAYPCFCYWCLFFLPISSSLFPSLLLFHSFILIFLSFLSISLPPAPFSSLVSHPHHYFTDHLLKQTKCELTKSHNKYLLHKFLHDWHILNTCL